MKQGKLNGMYFLPSLIGLISDWKKYLLTNQAKQIRPQRLAGTQLHRFYVKRNNCTVFTTPGTEAEVRYLYRDRNLCGVLRESVMAQRGTFLTRFLVRK